MIFPIAFLEGNAYNYGAERPGALHFQPKEGTVSLGLRISSFERLEPLDFPPIRFDTE
jgi:hypothetical protein